MSDFLKMDIFFVTTTIVTVLFGIGVVVAMFYIVKILRSADHLMRNVSEESDEVREDIERLRDTVREEGLRVRNIVDFFLGTQRIMTSKAKKPPHKTRAKVTAEGE